MVNDHFRLHQVHGHGQALATVFGGVRQALPATGHVLGVGFLEALGRGYHAVVEVAALEVTGVVDGREDLFAEGGASFQDGLDHVGGGVAAVGQLGVVAGVVEDFVQQELDVTQRGFVLRHVSPRFSVGKKVAGIS
jgi:hypothetical protein